MVGVGKSCKQNLVCHRKKTISPSHRSSKSRHFLCHPRFQLLWLWYRAQRRTASCYTPKELKSPWCVLLGTLRVLCKLSARSLSAYPLVRWFQKGMTDWPNSMRKGWKYPPPPRTNSHLFHYYSIFSESPIKPSFTTDTGWGVDPTYSLGRKA